MTFFSLCSQFLSSAVVNHDKILISCDFIFFNQTSEPLNSLNFTQLVSGPTHSHGHTLHLVFTHGLTIPFLTVEQMGMPDHLWVRFSTLFPPFTKPQLPASYSCTINPSSASKYCDTYITSSLFCNRPIPPACGQIS